MEKIKIREEIFSKYYKGETYSFPFGDLPKDIQPDDIIEFVFEDVYGDDHSMLCIYRERLETDEELEERKQDVAERNEHILRLRREVYFKLKQEFEGEEIK